MQNEKLTVHGVYTLSNFGGLEVSVVDGADYLYWRNNYGKPERWRRARIYYTKSYGAYFTAGGFRVYLSEVMRI